MTKKFIKLRKDIEDNEAKILSSLAILSKLSRGRQYLEEIDEQRTCFQRDRDRIIHCRSFRRLKGKTQVFVTHYGDHFRSRLTHSLEVAQLSRDIARSFAVNEDLAESIALAHDLGHTPFGHAGEEAVNEMMQQFGKKFEHNEQSKRTVEFLEHKSPLFPGLNLSYEIRDGLIKHRSPHDNPRQFSHRQGSLEAQIVNLADEIAYQNHDIDDGLRSGIFTIKDLEKCSLWKRACYKVGRNLPEKYKISETISAMIKIMVFDLFKETACRLQKIDAKNSDDIQNSKMPVVAFAHELKAENDELRQFLFKRLYLTSEVLEQSNHGKNIIRKIFTYLLKNPKKLPAELQDRILEESLEDVVKDFVAGMTDNFAIEFSESI